MTNEFNVIGEHKDDDEHLLVVGDDGRHYDYSLTKESVEPIEVDDSWNIDEPIIDRDDTLVDPPEGTIA